MPLSVENHYSKLDSKRFNIKVAKINDFGDNALQVLSSLSKSCYKLILSKINANNIELLNLLENSGFRIKDAQVTYKYNLAKFDPILLTYLDDPCVTIREYKIDDIEQIVKLTEASFYNYGHYSADNKLDKKLCLEIYKDWAFRSCTDKNIADKVFVAQIDNEIAGFLSFKVFNENGKTYAAGGLGAVSKKYRGKDVFKKITIKALQWGIENHFAWEEHNVLINNYPVNRCFSKLGFVVFKSFYTLHCWL